ncbi:MAG TPA: hypothetical protein VHA73_06795 [Acidimicrobiales bacterium]|nr:hypothetical protein [Acidimicrobiales bacterium]
MGPDEVGPVEVTTVDVTTGGSAASGTPVVANARPDRFTSIGTIDGPALAAVDPRGLVTPGGASWSLDWWVGADDRWHLPSEEVAVRQRPLGAAPVVETAMRIPNGDAVQRVYAAQVPDGHVVVVEVENRSSMPFALAWAVRPFVRGRVGSVGSVVVEGRTVVARPAAGSAAHDAPAVVLDRGPGRVAVGAGSGGDLASVVLLGEAALVPEGPATAACPRGLAQAVAIVAVPHRATVRVVVPLDVGHPIAPTFPPVLPTADDVVAGWDIHCGTERRIVLPDSQLAEAAARAHRRLLLGATEGGAAGSTLVSRLDPLAVVAVLDALVDAGHDHEAGQILASWLLAEPRSVGAGAPALVALARYWSATGDDDLVRAGREILRDMAAAVASSAARTDLPVALRCWSVAALQAAASLLDEIGDHRAAADARHTVGTLADARDAALSALTGPSGHAGSSDADADDHRANGAGAGGRVADEARAQARAVVAAVAAGALAASHPGVGPVVAGAGDEGEHGSLVEELDAATVAVRRGEADATVRLERLAATASDAGAWGTGGDDDLAVAARLLRAARALAVVEVGGRLDGARQATATGGQGPDQGEGAGEHRAARELTLCPAWPSEWRGSGLEAHGIRFGASAVSFAVRWHGERPAVLWEVDGPPVTLRSGLDPTWSTVEHRGETLWHPTPR